MQSPSHQLTAADATRRRYWLWLSMIASDSQAGIPPHRNLFGIEWEFGEVPEQIHSEELMLIEIQDRGPSIGKSLDELRIREKSSSIRQSN